VPRRKGARTLDFLTSSAAVNNAPTFLNNLSVAQSAESQVPTSSLCRLADRRRRLIGKTAASVRTFGESIVSSTASYGRHCIVIAVAGSTAAAQRLTRTDGRTDRRTDERLTTDRREHHEKTLLQRARCPSDAQYTYHLRPRRHNRQLTPKSTNFMIVISFSACCMKTCID